MIASIKGKVIENDGARVVVETFSGVGYAVMVTEKAAEHLRIGQEVFLSTYLVVRENAMELFGFVHNEEKELFLKFLLVSGIGPRTALHLLSLGSVEEISGAIARGDVAYLTNVSGVGKKTAERIMVELKSKITAPIVGSSTLRRDEDSEKLSDAIDGLVAMGYSIEEARTVIKTLNPNGKKAEELLKEALQQIR